MKIDRLIGILSVLLQKEAVTAPYLAEKFEVPGAPSERDIEALVQKRGFHCDKAGGANGGSSLWRTIKSTVRCLPTDWSCWTFCRTSQS